MLDGPAAERDAVRWYWRLVALGSWFMILGGFLMSPSTFDNDPLLRVSRVALGIFAVVLLTAGFSLTALLAFAVRNPLFHANAIFTPALASSVFGLLTIFYDFLISTRYVWNTAALLLTIAASVSTVVYGALLFYTHRKMNHVKAASQGRSMDTAAASRPDSRGSGTGLWQDPTYYENYVRNMYPTSTHLQEPTGYDPNVITEEEMQRQQMLMLLLQRDQTQTPDPSGSTYNIEWQGQDHDDPPPGGYYATPTAYPNTAHPPQSGISSAWTTQAPPWDGVWRGVATPSTSSSQRVRDTSRDQREERRRQIEQGR